MVDKPLDLAACERRIYGVDVPYTHIVLREVPLLLAEVKRLRGLLERKEAADHP